MSFVVEQSWFFKHQINLFAANLQYRYEAFKGQSKLAYYSSGSGIYSFKHAIEYHISDINLSITTGEILTGEVPEEAIFLQTIIEKCFALRTLSLEHQLI